MLLATLEIGAQRAHLEWTLDHLDQELWTVRAYWQSAQPGNQMIWQLKGAQNLAVFLEEGRIKGPLDFTYQADTLQVHTFQQLSFNSRVMMRYQISRQALEEQGIYASLEQGFLLYPLNLAADQPYADLAHLIPISALPCDMSFQIEQGAGQFIHLPYEPSFVVEDGSKAYWFYDQKAASLSQFYLALSGDEDWEPKDYWRDKEALELALKEQRLSAVKSRFKAWAQHLSKKGYEINEEQWLSFEEEPLGEEGFFFRPHELAQDRPTLSLNAARSFALHLGLSKAELAPLEWAFFGGDEEWRQAFFKQRIQEGPQGLFFWQLYEADWQARQQAFDGENCASPGWATLWVETQAWPKLDFSYRFLAREKKLYLTTRSSDSSGLAFPARLEAIFKDSSIFRDFCFRILPHDTVLLDLNKAPLSLQFSYPQQPPVEIREARPELYYLYDLSKSKDPMRKREALQSLLNTKNLGLLATVIGVALDSGEEDLQLLALAEVNRLNVNGLQRLDSTLKALAQEAKVPKVMQKAQALVRELGL